MKIKLGDKVFLMRKRLWIFSYKYRTAVRWIRDDFAMVSGIKGYVPINSLTVINDE